MSGWALYLAAAVTGLAASVHCAAMCALPQRLALRGIPIVTVAASADAASPAAGADLGLTRDWLGLQAGRIAGYATLGLLIGGFGEAMLAAARWQRVFESAWAALNAALLLIGLAFLVGGREPRWAIAGWRWRPPPVSGSTGAFGRGMLWALMPCGALYGAAGLAVLAARPLAAAGVMALFGITTTVGLAIVHRVLQRADARAATAGYRLQGAMLMIPAAIGLAAAIAGLEHPFCR